MNKNNIDEFRAYLTQTLPPIIARSSIEKLTGRLVKLICRDQYFT